MPTTHTHTTRPLLEVRNLSRHFAVRQGTFGGQGSALAALDRVSFNIDRGQVFGLVGESGSGKSTLARAIVQLVKPESGQVLFDGQDLLGMGPRDLRAARRRIQIIFQDPSGALSPRRTILQTLTEPLHQFRIGQAPERIDLAAQALQTVGLDSGALPRLPHQFSSGQRQRIGIARALLTNPDLVIADEAVSSLDVSVQAQILELILRLRHDRGIAFLFISHDLAVIQLVADVAGVMFRGQLVELAPCETLFNDPAHPYTRQLLAAVPDPDPSVQRKSDFSSAGLTRMVVEKGCVFAHRCPKVMAHCLESEPHECRPSSAVAHRVKCHLYNPDDTTA